MTSNSSSTSSNQKFNFDQNLNITVEVPFDFVPKIDEELSKMKKKIGKYNFNFQVVKVPALVTYKKHKINGIKYIIHAEAPEIKYKDFTYLATLKKENVKSDDFLVHASVKAENLDLSQYHNIKFRCDHCGTQRKRKMVHVFRNDAGKDMVVATSCSKAYFGIDIESRLRKVVQYFELNIFGNFIEDYIDDGEWISKHTPIPVDKEGFCKIVFGVILSNHGGVYIPQLGSSADNLSTASLAQKLYNNKKDKHYLQQTREMIKLANSKKYSYEAIYEYWQAKTDNDNFTHNVKIALNMIQPKMGLLAYAVWNYIQHKVLTNHRKNFFDYNSNHVGIVGAKISNIAEIINVKESNGLYGFYQIIHFVDDKENLYTWFYNGSLSSKYQIGTKVKLSGTVKKHDIFNKQKVNIIKRAKLEII